MENDGVRFARRVVTTLTGYQRYWSTNIGTIHDGQREHSPAHVPPDLDLVLLDHDLGSHLLAHVVAS